MRAPAVRNPDLTKIRFKEVSEEAEPYDYQVAIPSYQRPQELVGKTLRTLEEKGVTFDRITVFLHHTDPFLSEYAEALDMLDVKSVVTSANGIGEQRLAILEHYDLGERVVSIDDDITDVMSATGKNWRTEYTVPSLDAFFRQMFFEIDQRELSIWGTAPVDNPFFMTPDRISEGLKLVMYTMYGFINRGSDHPIHEQTVRYKDEQEFSLRAWWYDGGVARSESVAVKTEFFTAGGCQAAGRTFEQVEESVQSLLCQWPDLIRRNDKRKSDWPEVQLARRARTEGHPLDTPPPGVDLL